MGRGSHESVSCLPFGVSEMHVEELQRKAHKELRKTKHLDKKIEGAREKNERSHRA
jgi:hypothetical protein